MDSERSHGGVLQTHCDRFGRPGLGGTSATGLSGLGTTTLTWTFTGITNATLSTSLAGTGANAIKDAAGNGLAGGSGFSQAFSVLYGDFNGDGVVTAADLGLSIPPGLAPYNILADINGDGVVNTTDVNNRRVTKWGVRSIKEMAYPI